MNSSIVIVVVVQFIFACTPLNGQAAAPDPDKDPDQLWNIGWELSQDCLKHRETLRVRDNRQARYRGRGRMVSMLQQSALLQELLTPGYGSPASNHMKNENIAVHRISYGIDTQESGILEELLVEASMP